MTRNGNRITINWESYGAFAFPYPRVELVMYGVRAVRAVCDGKEIMAKENRIECERFNQIQIEVDVS